MSEHEFLIAIAELSIALIAFTNIVVALKQMGGGCLSQFQVLVVRLFSVCGFCAIFFALLPILLDYFGLEKAWVWRLSNPLLGIAMDGSIAPFAFTLVALLVASAVAFLNTLSDFLIAPG